MTKAMITTLNKIEKIKILENNYIGHLSYIYRGRPFITPITYYYNKAEDTLLGYSSEGHKVRAMRRNTSVCLNVSEIDSVNSWVSVLVQGEFFELSASNAKTQLRVFSNGIKAIITKKEDRELNFLSEFSSKASDDNVPVVFTIKIHELSGKASKLKLD
jgi:nitroimidazol reductase NimA-like FMN-containing flavoprotein (pyridoxamine 5'-phosphate oxidase superfamily)